MTTTAWSELLSLPEEVASSRYLDGLNLQALRWLVAGGSVAAFVPLMIFFSESMYPRAGAVGGVLLGNLMLLLMRERPFFRRHVSLILFAYLVLVQLVVVFAASQPMAAWSMGTIALGALSLVVLRWRESLLWTLAAVCLVIGVWAVLEAKTAESATALVIFSAAWIGGMALVGRRITRQRLEGFRIEHRRQGSIERERARMRDELDDARVVQLSMLPQQAPDLPWLDVASVSVPATEVGGDYYDYFELDENRVVLVIGDVSGHGMSSGLVLAAVRGGLHLLRHQLDRPVEVLVRLDAMLRATTPGRMFVTLLLAVIDRSRREIVVANAGHPQALLLGRRGAERLGRPGRPLGTRLEGEFEAQKLAFEPGDVAVFYTDGATELTNFRGEPFGTQRLEREALRKGPEGGAKDLRDRLLSSLTHFRADVEQADDVTLVVVGLEPGMSSN